MDIGADIFTHGGFENVLRTVNFNTTDQDGEHHTLVITGDVTISNYGTTTVQPLDVGDREKYA